VKTDQLTPFLEAILDDVRKACAPGLPNWELALCKRLRDRFYRDAVPEPGKPVLSEQAMAIHARLWAVEERLCATPAPTAQRREDFTNF
jgi:hypothetical protein